MRSQTNGWLWMLVLAVTAAGAGAMVIVGGQFSASGSSSTSASFTLTDVAGTGLEGGVAESASYSEHVGSFAFVESPSQVGDWLSLQD